MKNIELINLLENIKIDRTSLLRTYVYGSFLYGTDNEQSDRDYVCVFDVESILGQQHYQYSNESIDVHCLTLSEYEKLLKEHDIMAIECYSQDIQKNIEPLVVFEVNKSILRKSFSSKSSNSWVKAKKKMILPEEDSYIGLKSLYHSFRILDFGIQISENGYITNFSGNFDNFLLDFENDKEYNWQYWNERLKKDYNNLKSSFKLSAPK